VAGVAPTGRPTPRQDEATFRAPPVDRRRKTTAVRAFPTLPRQQIIASCVGMADAQAVPQTVEEVANTAR